jgi:hypothetical protein
MLKQTYNAIRYGRYKEENQRKAFETFADKMEDGNDKQEFKKRIDKYTNRATRANTRLTNEHEQDDES